MGRWALGSQPPSRKEREGEQMFAKQPSCEGLQDTSSDWEGMKGGGPGAETHPAGQGYKRAGQSAERGAPGERRTAG